MRAAASSVIAAGTDSISAHDRLGGVRGRASERTTWGPILQRSRAGGVDVRGR
jgi:hypothetical protein